MELTVADVIGFALVTTVLVLAGREIPTIWQEDGAQTFESRLRSGLPYLSDGMVRSVCQALPASVSTLAFMTLAVAAGFVIPLLDESSLPKDILVFATLVAGIAGIASAVLAVSAAVAAKPDWIVPPPFRR